MISTNPRALPMAVVGLAAQLPAGNHAEQNLDRRTFWEFLLAKGEAYEKIPQSRLDQLSNMPSAWGSFLKGITEFDNVEFGISSKDAMSMTASTRRAIELSFLALLDSGVDSREKRIGTFMAGTNVEGFEGGTKSFGSASNTLANRVAYTLNVTGPSVYLDTACSSTMTATHLAIRSIENGDCDAAIVGGSQHNMDLWEWHNYMDGGILSPDRKCKPFDAAANGFIKGEGAVSIVIKPLSTAISDKDYIYAVILGSSINSNGARASLHAPSGIAQQECIRAAFARAGRDPTEVDFVELHATGTAIGDPIEANAAGKLFARSDELIIGSVKGNLGHLESTAFLASLLKACLILEHKVVPPNANFNVPNPKIRWDKYNLKVPTGPLPLGCRSSSGKSLVSLASTGIGGSNGHVVLESSPELDPPASLLVSEIPVLFIVGGLSPRAAQEISESVVDIVKNDESKEALSQAVTHTRRARQLPWRTYFVYTPGSPTAPDIPSPVLIPMVKPPVVFVFTGQGPQHIEMGRNLFAAHRAFRESILEMDKVYEEVTGASLIQNTGLFDNAYPSTLPTIWSAEITMPAMTFLQIALFDLFASIGVIPDVLVGHSAGEIPMIYASGAGSKAMAVEICIARGKAMKLTEPLGAGMAAIACNAAKAVTLVEQVKSEMTGILEVACHNSPDAVVISGSRDLVDRAIDLAQNSNIFARRIHTLNPSHTSLVDLSKADYESGLQRIFTRYRGSYVPKIPSYSTVCGRGRFIREFSTEYLWDNIRQPVHFHQSISSILEDYPAAAFVEISPHPVLSPYISAVGVPSNNVSCPMRRPSKHASGIQLEVSSFAETLGLLATLGINTIDLSALYGRASRDPVYDIPYPFITRHFPLRVDGPRELPASSSGTCSLRFKANTKTFPDLAEHVINGEPIFPAAAYIDLILQTGAKILWDVDFKAFLSLASETPGETRVEHEGSKWTVKTAFKKTDSSDGDVRIHAEGFSSFNSSVEPPSIDILAVLSRLDPVDTDYFYGSLKPLADFGPKFQRLVSLYGDYQEAVAEIHTQSTDESPNNYVFHPVILDACFHWTLHPAILQNPEIDAVFLPSKARKFSFYRSPNPDESVYSHFVLKKWTPETRVADLTVCDVFGNVLCKIKGLELRRFSSKSYAVKTRYDIQIQPVLIFQPLPRCNTGWSRDNLDGFLAIHTVLDHMAVDLFKKSLEKGVVVGSEVNRKRYFEFAKSAILRSLPPLPGPEVIKRVQSTWPHYFEITKRVAAIHKDMFSSTQRLVQALFSDDILNGYYSTKDGFFGPVCEQATQIFDDAISSLYKQGKRVVKVLEVGAGTGLLTRSLCNLLERRQEEDLVVQYVVSDISLALATSTASSTSYKYCSAMSYDLTQPSDAQGISAGSFDIITGLHVLHATPDIAITLSNMLHLLVGGGSIMIVELNGSSWRQGKPGVIWHDLVFGGFSEWFGSTDGRNHCSLSPEDWTASLLREGYEDVQTSAEADGGIEFIFTAQKPHSGFPDSPKLDVPSPVFLTYRYGDEMVLRDKIATLDINQHLTLWLLAKDGLDGDAGRGLASCLCVEFTDWNVHIGIFEDVEDEADRISMVLRHEEFLKNDTIVRFHKNGLPYVLKVVPAPAPAHEVLRKSNPSSWWADTGSDLIELRRSPLMDHQVCVDVTSMSSSFVSWRGFVGSVVESKNARLAPGSTVLGIAQTQVSNLVVCDSGQVALLSSDTLDERLAGYALPMVIASLALGPLRLSDPTVILPLMKILVAGEDELSKALFRFLSLLPSFACVEMGSASDDAEFNLIIVDSATLETRPEIAFWQGRLFIWDRVIRDRLDTDPWCIEYSLKSALQLAVPGTFSPDIQLIRPQDLSLIVSKEFDSATRPLFQDSKAYLLIGGGSDLGVYLALWMYQNGARYIVLTCRRGRKFLDTNRSVPTHQRLAYMESRDDLCLRVEACDALCVEATSSLVQSCGMPIGGCIIMTLVLEDQLFIHQTEETFRKVCDTKLKAVKTLNRASPIEKLDFLMFLSSSVALLGNIGQSNYGVANTAVEGFLANYPNTFSISLPGITNIGYLARVEAENDTFNRRFGRWSCPPEAMCSWIKDGLLKLSRGNRAVHYIPDLLWKFIEEDVGLPNIVRHLVAHEACGQGGGKEDKSNILGIVLDLLDVDASDFSPDVPFTAYGLDSLGATRVSEAIRPFANVSQMQLLGGMTWKQLEKKLDVTDGTLDHASPLSVEPMLQMVNRYGQDFRVHRPSVAASAGDIIMVTGTTGSLGASVLCDLVALSVVRRVYAVNRRATDGRTLRDRQRDALESRGLDPGIADSPKVVLLEADFDSGDFGFQKTVVHEIRASVTHIIHCAWIVNWTLGLREFEPNVRGVRHLIDLCLSSSLPTPPRFIFLSSVSAVYNHAWSTEAIPERFVDADLAVSSGYGESKWVAERLLQLVASETSLRPVVIRLSQVCGALNGMWNSHEWIPGIVQTADSIRCLPEVGTSVSWLPLDVASAAIVEARNSLAPVLHLVNPRRMAWNDVFKPMAAYLAVPLVPWKQWLARLDEVLSSRDKNSRNDFVYTRLIELYRQAPLHTDPEAETVAPRMSNEVALRELPSLAAARPLSHEDVEKWLLYWRRVGLISF